MKVLVEHTFINEKGIETKERFVVYDFETISFFGYRDFLSHYTHCNILGICDDKGKLLPNRFGIDLSKYSDDSNIYDITCAGCIHEKECHEACEICSIDECPIRQLAALLLEASDLKDEAYYEAEDNLVNELYSLSDTKFKDFVLLNPTSILKGCD